MPDYRNYELDPLANARAKDEICLKNNPKKTSYISDFSQENSKDMAQNFVKCYSIIEGSWQEQRDYLKKALDSLTAPHRKEALNALGVRWKGIKTLGKQVRENLRPLKSYELGGFKEVVFGAEGQLTGMKKMDGRGLKAGRLSLGRLVHQSFDHIDYARFIKQYNDNYEKTYRWSNADFGKPGLEFCAVESKKTTAVLESLHHYPIDEKEDHIVGILSFGDEVEHKYGLPDKIKVSYRLFDGNSVEIEVEFLEKKAVRLPEALWLEAKIPVDNDACWNLIKMSSEVSPYDVVSGGNRNLHAVEVCFYEGAEAKITLSSQTTPLLSVGGMKLLTFDNRVWGTESGLYYNLYNNVWGTNFPAWIEGDFLCQFHMKWS